MKTVWALSKGSFNDADIVWCRGLGVDVHTEPIFNNIYSYGKLLSQEIRGWKVRLTTTDTQQETMLKLKYGDQLQLVR